MSVQAVDLRPKPRAPREREPRIIPDVHVETNGVRPPAHEVMAEQAWLVRPYANPDLIFKPIDRGGRRYYFTIDPWTQRWALLEPEGRSLLEQCDGRTRLADVVGRLNDAGLTSPCGSFVGMASDLVDEGLLFNNADEHRRSGIGVYNHVEPIGFHLEITNACNMVCTHCYVSSGTRMPSELTYDEIISAIDMLTPFTGKRIAISGGEPAVRKDCGDIVEYCAIDCGHDVDLYTNGKRFPRKLADRILAINARGLGQVRIQVSIEGADAATNDAVRGEGSFAETMATLELFREIGLNRAVVLFACVTTANIDQISDMIALAEHHDAAMLVFSQWQRQGNAEDTPWAEIAPSTEQWVAAGELLARYDNPRLEVHGNFYGDLNNNLKGRFAIDAPAFPKHIYSYNVFPRITPVGEVFADQLWVDLTWAIGNVRDDTLDECFRRPEYYAQLEGMHRRVENIPECQKCEWVQLCQAGSPGHTYAEYGHMNAKDLFCDSRMYWFERYVTHHVDRILGPL